MLGVGPKVTVVAGSATLLLVAGLLAWGFKPVVAGGGGSASCQFYDDWREDDIFFDDEFHTGNLNWDPNNENPAGEWYEEGTVWAKFAHHTGLADGYTLDADEHIHISCGGEN